MDFDKTIPKRSAPLTLGRIAEMNLLPLEAYAQAQNQRLFFMHKDTFQEVYRSNQIS